jgi:cyclophilin family peptidyl-prolyl cis-trans isomerase
MKRLFAALIALALPALSMEAAAVELQDPDNTLVIRTDDGEIYIQMLPQVAPGHVARIKELAREDFYDGVVFHRVIEGFMAQTGDPTGTGRGGSDKPDLKAEFSNIPFERGTLGMARTPDPNSANSQFFIMFTQYPSLNGQYTVWGQVIEGMDVVERINRGEPPAEPTVMRDVYVAGDRAE